jgi:predicted glycosyltransferase
MIPSRRFLLFSNEMIGLGHLRRTLAITARLAQVDPHATSLIVTGSSVQALFDLPPRVEAVTLPTLTRDENGARRARRLALEIGDVGHLRTHIARAVAVAFEPDCAIVDRFPLGLEGELEPALAALRAAGCKLVLGLRDIEDDPVEVRRTWGPEVREAIRRYDLVLVYGPTVPTLDALDCLGWHDADLSVPVVHVGYVGRGVPATGPPDLPKDYVLATVGGGSDGYDVLAAFVAAVQLEPLPCPAVVVTGPLMPAEEVDRLRALAHGCAVHVCRFRPDLEDLIAGSRAVVCMAGYNTVAEVMRAGKPALLVPRVRPISEQLWRARELERRGLQDVLHPDDLTPSRMRAALGRLLARPRPALDEEHFRGTERTAELLTALVRGAPTRANGGRPSGNGRRTLPIETGPER